MSDDLNSKLASIDVTGKSRYGDENWNAAVDAIKKFTGGAGIPPGEMAQVANGPDPADYLMRLGKHALMQQASDGDKDAEAAYSSMRQAERKKHFERKGRVF